MRANDYAGEKVLLEQLPKYIKRPATDMGYDANWVRNALESMGIEPCILGRKNRVVAIEHDRRVFRSRR